MQPTWIMGVHIVPDSSNDVPDEMFARLVILGPEYPHALRDAESLARKQAEDILLNRGAGLRMYRNTLIFLVPDRDRLRDLEQTIREYMAWKSISEEREELNLMLIMDGEVTDEKAKRWISTSGIQGCNYVVLPGGLPPEEWCIKVTNCHEGWESLSDFFKLPIQEIREYLDKLKSLRDKHDIFHEWSNLTGRSIDKVRMGFLNAVANLPHRPLKMIQEAVETTLSDYSSSKVAATYDE